MHPWDCIDHAYVITLRDQTRRQQVTRDELRKVKLLPKTTFYYASKHPNGGVQGCYESHAAVLAIAAARRFAKPVLILEDDIYFTNDWHKHVKHVVAFLQNAPRDMWDLFLLGHLPLRTKPMGKHIQQVLCSVLTHAYIVSPQSLARLDTWLPPFAGLHVDHVLLCNQCTRKQMLTPLSTCMRGGAGAANIQVYALMPMIAMQRHDNVSNAAKSTQFVTRALANHRLMRTLAVTSQTVDTPTFITTITILCAVTVVTAIILAIALPIALRKKGT